METKTPTWGWSHIRKSPITSIIGTLIMLGAGAYPFVKDSGTWTEAAIGICIGATLFLAPDTLVNKLSKIRGEAK